MMISTPIRTGLLLAALILTAASGTSGLAAETARGAPPPLDLRAMIQPFSERNVFKLDDYFCWCPHLLRGEDGRYYLIYSRWPKSSKQGGWLTQSEVAVAVGEQPDGPFQHVKVLLQGRGPGHWDELMAHNPKLYRFEGKYYLYYISSRAGPTRGHVRDSQRTGVAVADAILGPYRRLDHPIVEPTPPVHNVTVNPAVTPLTDGRYLMMLKGDLRPKAPEDKVGQRVQGLAVADRPEGPFRIRPELAVGDINTEDASIWYDAGRRSYFAVFHAYEHIALIESPDGFNWRRAPRFQVTEGNTLRRTDGTILSTRPPLQRPDILIENGVPRVLTLAIAAPTDWYCVMVPLAAKP